jgi:hypothetical protein
MKKIAANHVWCNPFLEDFAEKGNQMMIPPISPKLARIAAEWHMRRAMGRASHYPVTDLRGPSPGESLELATADMFYYLAMDPSDTFAT